MKAFCTALLLLSFSIIGHTNSSLDSLKNELKNYTESDSQRVNILNQLGYEYWIMDPVESEKYAYQALELAKELSYESGEAYANRSIGVANWAQGNYEEGLEFLITSLVAYQALQDTLNIANVMMNTGLIYYEQGSYEEALSYYNEALKTFEVLKKPERQINTTNHIGELYQNQKKFQDALIFYRKALILSDSLDYSYGQATANLNLGSLFKDEGELDSALFYCNRAFELQSENHDWHGRAFTLYTIGTIHVLKNDLYQAEQNLLQGLSSAELVSSKKLRRDIYLKLKEIATVQNKYQKALDYFEQYDMLNDSLLNAEKLREFVRLENKFDLEKKEQQVQMKQRELELLKQQAKLDNFLLDTLIIGIVVILLIAYLIISRQRLKVQKNKEIYEANDALAQVELENSKLKEKELTTKIDFKNKELTSYSLNFMRKNELMEEIKHTINELKKLQNKETTQKLNSLSKLVTGSMHIDKDWQDFKRQFEEVHADFFGTLKKHCPDITSNELKLSALLKLNMNLKEAAGIMGISPESVKTARYRLRKKLNLNRDENLVDYMIKIEQELK